MPRPFDFLRTMGAQEVQISPSLCHVEIFTPEGLLTLLWHGRRDAEHVVVMSAGALGGLLGPARGLFHELAMALADQGIGAIRVGYRVPNNLDECVLDVCAAIDLASRMGCRRAVTVGHSFGGAVAVRAGVALSDEVVGVVGLATQSAGCEVAGGLAGRPLLLVHGDRDDILPPEASEVVAAMAGGAQVEMLAGAGHLFINEAPQVFDLLLDWIPPVLFSGDDRAPDH